MRGFARISAAVPAVRVADVPSNLAETLALWRRSHEQGDALVAFPELGLSGYTARDLFHDKIGAPRGLVRIVHNGVSPAEFEPVPVADDATVAPRPAEPGDEGALARPGRGTGPGPARRSPSRMRRCSRGCPAARRPSRPGP